MNRLCKMMLEELQRRNYSEITTRKHLQVVTDFARYFGSSTDKVGPNELRRYQAYLLKGWLPGGNWYGRKAFRVPGVPRQNGKPLGPARADP